MSNQTSLTSYMKRPLGDITNTVEENESNEGEKEVKKKRKGKNTCQLSYIYM